MLARTCLFVLMAAVPFEPRMALALGWINISALEFMLAISAIGLAVSLPSLRALASRCTHPVVVSLWLFALSSIASALLSEDVGAGLKFALRFVAMVFFAFMASGQSAKTLQAGFAGLVSGAIVAAVLAILEGAGARFLDPLLGAFREIPFNVAGIRRASAGSEYPNLGGAMIVYGICTATALFRGRAALRYVTLGVLTVGLLFTYSRGAWVAGFIGLLSSAIAEKTNTRFRFMPLTICAGLTALFVFRAEITQLRLQGENANDFYSARYEVPQEYTVEAGSRSKVPVRVTNTGRRPWRRHERFHLSYHLYTSDQELLRDGPRTALPRDVEPGDTVVVDAEIRVPAQSGSTLLMWDLVHEDTTWFSGQGTRPGVTRLVISRRDQQEAPPEPGALDVERAIRAIPDDLGWRPSRLELWSIAGRMWARRPLLGMGPDAYRRTYGTWAGRDTFDRRVYANNTYLELAATVGTLGLATFCLAMVTALRPRRFGNDDDPRVALASRAILVVIATHGFVDYVLAFTGHYVVLAFALGAAISQGDADRQPFDTNV